MRWQSVVGMTLLLIGTVSYFLVPYLIPGLGWIDLPRVPGQPAYQLHAVVLMAPGLIMGLGVALTRPFLDTDWDAPDRASDLAGTTVIVVIIGVAGLLLAAVVTDKVSPVTAGLVLVMATVTLLIALQTLDKVRRSEGIAFESHWGGLGGGLGGWRLSKTATLMLLLLVFASATVAIALYQPADEEDDQKTAPATPTPPAAPAAKGA